MVYNSEQRAYATITYELTKSYIRTARKFSTKFGKKAPSRKTVLKWDNNLHEIGSMVKPSPSKRIATKLTTEKVYEIRQHFQENPKTSIRRASFELDISSSSVIRVLHQSKFHPYKIQFVQALSEKDHDTRLRFARAQLIRLNSDENYLPHLFFSDEAHFHINGRVHKHNCRYWSKENPHWFSEQPLHSPRITVWAAIWQGGLIGPYFFEENVDGPAYLQMLKDFFLPIIQAKGLAEDIIFMQDGAPPHWSKNVRSWLDVTWPERWMGRGSTNLPWPPRSPDITPCDYFLWGYLKSIVYKNEYKTINDLKKKIKQVCDEHLSTDVCERALQDYQRRLQKCVERGGKHIEV